MTLTGWTDWMRGYDLVGRSERVVEYLRRTGYKGTLPMPEPVTQVASSQQELENNPGVRLWAHGPGACSGPRCPIHKRTAHHMRGWPQVWRNDRGIMERVCEHGVGHPDPDDPTFERVEAAAVHGCDGCCR